MGSHAGRELHRDDRIEGRVGVVREVLKDTKPIFQKDSQMLLVNRVIDFLVAQARKKHSVEKRALATILGVSFFVAGIPTLVWWSGRLFGRGLIAPAPFALIAALACFIAGIPWVVAAVFWQLSRGKGTPVPVVPTKEFLQNGPYRFVRNPMILGFFLYLLGWACACNRIGAFVATGLIIAFLLCEIKFIEEPELAKRFGSAYLDYKKETPFFVPHRRRKPAK